MTRVGTKAKGLCVLHSADYQVGDLENSSSQTQEASSHSQENNHLGSIEERERGDETDNPDTSAKGWGDCHYFPEFMKLW